MATALTDSSSFEDVTVCSICFEKYKTPRYLPCAHSFCHDCLSSHILSVCKSSEPRLGFNCPLCRKYTPVIGPFDKPEKWAETFPVNEILEKILLSADQKMCDSCMRDNEEEEASDFCLSCLEFLCKMCTKFHRKHLLSRDHSICPLKELKSQHIQSAFGKDDICKKHPDQKLTHYCNKHEEPCCVVCGGMEHRQCDSIDPIERAAETFKASGTLDCILQDVRNFKQTLTHAKGKQERNITELEDTLDKVTEETEKELNDLVCLLERLKTEHLDEISAVVKKSKETLARNVGTLSDGIQCADFCSDILEKAKGKEDESTLLIKYYAAKEAFQNLKAITFRTKLIQIMAMKEPIVKEIANMKKLASVKVTELVEDLPEFSFDVSSVQLCSITKFNVSEGRIHRGAWLSNKTFIFSDGEKGRFCYGELSKKEWKLIGIQESLQNPFDILPDRDDLFVACADSQSIDVFSVFDFKISRTIYLGFYALGISRLKEYFYLACGSKIVKIDNVGNKIKSLKTTGSSAFNILTTESGFIVYTDWKLDKVSAITDQWESVWDYTSPDLKCPYGLDSDSQGNIYVTGMHSHNIHVVSNSGELIRIFGNLKSPVFMKIAKKNNVCCICSNYEALTFYEMK